VEGVLSQHPGILRCVVVGVPEVRLTEMVAACVQLRHGWRWDENDEVEDFHCLSRRILNNFCRQKRLTGFKIPKRYFLWGGSDFPLTTTGKIRRDEVRTRVMSFNNHYYAASKI
ncbi:hypothetical protein M569_15533, partial [Genlisea aurea]